MSAAPLVPPAPPDLSALLKVRLPEGRRPYPYQVEAVQFALEHRFRCLFADEMGLGKLVETLCCIAVAPKVLLPAIVVCPASVLGTWAQHLADWLPDIEVVLIRKRTDALGPPRRRRVYLLSWRMLRDRLDELRTRRARLAVLDEIQACKHANTLTAQSAFALCRTIPRLLLLSGTPIEGTAQDAWPILHLLDPRQFADEEDFAVRFTKPKVLRAVLGHYAIRRTKAEVKLDLPAKTRQLLWLDLPPRLFHFYEKVRHDLDAWLVVQFKRRNLALATENYHALRRTGVPKAEAVARALINANTAPPDTKTARLALVQIGHLWRLAGRLKVGQALQWVQDHFAGGGGPLVIFAWHRLVVARLCRGLRALNLRWTRVDGSVVGERREARFASFQAGMYDAIVLTRAANSGITLTAASDVLFAERWMVPAWEEQGEDRCHRIGQHNPSQVTYLMARGTVDERFHELVDTKRALVERVLTHDPVDTVLGESPAQGIVSRSLARVMATNLERQFAEATAAKITPRELVEALRKEAGLGPLRFSHPSP